MEQENKFGILVEIFYQHPNFQDTLQNLKIGDIVSSNK
jgi:hypothetical protein